MNESILCMNPVIPEKFACIPVEPALLDYLEKHGAISSYISTKIVESNGPARLQLLLDSLGVSWSDDSDSHTNSSPTTNKSMNTRFALLLNALRHTGFHSLASDLDCGRRINPFPGKSSNDQEMANISRRRGQLSLWIQLDAIKIDPKILTTLDSDVTSSSPTHVPTSAMLPSSVQYLSANRNNNNACNHQTHIDSSRPAHISHSPIWIENQQQTQSLGISTIQPKTINENRKPSRAERSPGCFTKFIRKLVPHKKQKKRSLDQKSASIKTPNENGGTILCYPTPPSPITDDRKSFSNIFMVAKLNILEKISNELYKILADPESSAHDCVVKYLEQTCGILVLGSHLFHRPQQPALPHTGPVLRIVTVATQPALVRKLADICKPYLQDDKRPDDAPPSASKMATDLRTVITKSGLLPELQVQDIRLSVELEPGEICNAIEELNQCTE